MNVSQLKQELDRLDSEIKTILLELDEDIPSETAIDGAPQTAIKMARWEKLRQELDTMTAPVATGDSQIIYKHRGGPTGDRITLEICDETAEKIFRCVFDGWCPVCCESEINLGEVICGDCFDKALRFRCQGPPLPGEEN